MLLRPSLRRNLAGAIILIGSLVDTAVLNAVGTGNVLGDLQRLLCQFRAIGLRPHVDTILSKIRGRIDTVGIVGEEITGFLIFRRFLTTVLYRIIALIKKVLCCACLDIVCKIRI